MTYSVIGIIATVVLLIINRDVLFVKKDKTNNDIIKNNYRLFLYGVLCYYITDLLWGILEANRLTTILFIDTTVHFAAMVGAVMLWTQYVVSYLNRKSLYEKILSYAGKIFFCFEIIIIIINIFYPVLFWLDEAGEYHAGIVRYITLGIQILLFVATSVYAFYVSLRTKESVQMRHLTIALFGISMTALITIQVFYPLLPFYAIGYMIGTCLLHSFVVEDEKEEYRRELEQAAILDQKQKRALYESRESLKDALDAAKKANNAKTAFLSNMSHEIRTPMNAIIGLDNVALSDPDISDKTREYLEKIDTAAKHLLNIINDILDMSRIESGTIVIKHEKFSLYNTIEHVNTIIGCQCSDKGIIYECQYKDSIDEFYVGDDMKLTQIMINILGNAVKFTKKGGKVLFLSEEISKMDDKSTLRFTFSDTGVGMNKEYIPQIWDAFSQEDSSSTNIYGSTGLGMPITKSIVELMNGSIEVKSEKNVGTTFIVTVTLQRAEENRYIEDDTNIPSEDMNVSNVNVNQISDDSDMLMGHKILMAEDMPINAEIIIALLESKGIEVEHAENGRKALEMYENNEAGYYDAVLMDMRMPEMDGLEASRNIRASDKSDAKSIPIIALTANAFDEDVQQSMQAGLNAHLSKPIEPDILFATIKKFLQ